MSLRRKTYDGNIVRRGVGDPEWRNPLLDKVSNDKLITPKRTRKAKSHLVEDDSIFQEDHDKDRYLITYADLITLLLGLFIILYAISNIDVAKYEKMMAALGNVFGTKNETVGLIGNSNIGGSRVSPIQTLRESLQGVIDQYGYGENVKLLEDKRGITIRILDNILFTSGDAKLNPKAESVLHKLALVLKKVPNDIRVEGHTDNIPIKNNLFPSNWQLSVARATNTAYYLMKNEGLSPEKVSIVGYAEYKPIATNDTPEGRALNRRVDIVILKR